MIYIFTDHDEVTDEMLASMIDLLPPVRREKAERYRYRAGKLSCTLSYMLFLYGYREEYGMNDIPDFSIGENEKPYLAQQPNIHFNISHCNHAVACMMSRFPVGIDIQEVRSVRDPFLDHVCSNRERERIEAAPNPHLEFTKIWTEKEAISKYTGDGVFRDVKNVSIDMTAPNLMVATVQVRPDLFMTACGEIEDANFTIREIRAAQLSEFVKGLQNRRN